MSSIPVNQDLTVDIDTKDPSVRIFIEPVKGVPIIEPKVLPEPGQVIIGYELIETKPRLSKFHKPNPRRMNKAGWLSLLALAICCWPCAAVPCFLSCSYDMCQRPVYGKKEVFAKDVHSITMQPLHITTTTQSQPTTIQDQKLI